ncbi:AAA family ATPase [Miltoncostaea marina]|uniref:AAA family ATPase n=1 Tax=Miltoncostaea marina TaxID=2843215 RepID=UPI001C3C4A65|nr:AAA family ATPase [Miltoncostaea marina]
MIEIDRQPLAQRILRAAVGRADPPQQMLLFGPPGTGKRRAAVEAAWAIMDPEGRHPRTTKALDLTVVEASGQQILLRDLEDALAQVAARPSVMRRRVLVIFDIERLREQESRLLKTLEEPPARSNIILVTDHPADLLDTIRSRCLPVPFRSVGWRAAMDRLGPFESRMHAIGVDLAVAALAGGEAAGGPGRLVRDVQARMEAAADGNPSEELVRLRAEAEALAGKRGERTATKRADDQEKRERRRMVTDGWTVVLDAAAATAADALAIAVGAERAVRHADRADDLRPVAVPERREFLERAIEEFQAARADLELNPSVELAAEALLVRIDEARHGAHGRLVRPGRLGY